MISSINKINALKIKNNNAEIINDTIENFFTDNIIFPIIDDTLWFNNIFIKDHTGWTTLESLRFYNQANWIGISSIIDNHEYEVIVDTNQLIPVYNPDVVKRASQGILKYEYSLLRAGDLTSDSVIRIITDDYEDIFTNPHINYDTSVNKKLYDPGYKLSTGSNFVTINGIQLSTKPFTLEKSFR